MNELQSGDGASVEKVLEMMREFQSYKNQIAQSLAQYDMKWVQEQAKSNVDELVFFDYIYKLFEKKEITFDKLQQIQKQFVGQRSSLAKFNTQWTKE